MIIEYARVSTQDQNPEFQDDSLATAGCEQIFQEKFTGKLRERPELSQCPRTFRKGDILVVWTGGLETGPACRFAERPS